jgi:hypothetical protein
MTQKKERRKDNGLLSNDLSLRIGLLQLSDVSGKRKSGYESRDIKKSESAVGEIFL